MNILSKTKYILGILLAFLLVGCGNSHQTLTCTQTSEDDGMRTVMTAVSNFVDDGAKMVDSDITMVFEATSEEMRSYWAFMLGMVDGIFSEIPTSEGLSVETQNDTENYKYTVKIHVNSDLLNDTDLQNEFLTGFDVSDLTTNNIEQVKASFEAQGFTC